MTEADWVQRRTQGVTNWAEFWPGAILGFERSMKRTVRQMDEVRLL